MKKLLLIGMILAICILAFPQGVSAATDAPVTVSANVNQILSCTATGLGAQTLTRGSLNEVNPFFTLGVVSTNNWQLTALDTSTDATSRGHMVPTSGHVPTVATFLVAPFGVGTTTAGGYAALPGPVTVATGLGNTAGITRGMTQTVGDTDWALTSGQYQIVVQFTCTNTDLPTGP
jgi:hypothetical protein